jgi:hypothetical protein
LRRADDGSVHVAVDVAPEEQVEVGIARELDQAWATAS